jgi:hypothetical protein
MLAAMKNGDLEGMVNCLDPAAKPQLEALLKGDDAAAQAKIKEIKTSMNDFLGESEGFHVAESTITGPDEVTAKVSFDGNGNVQTLVLKKFGGEWKMVNGF